MYADDNQLWHGAETIKKVQQVLNIIRLQLINFYVIKTAAPSQYFQMIWQFCRQEARKTSDGETATCCLL